MINKVNDNIIISDNDNIILCASFDIGKKNFSFYIQEINITELTKISNIPYINRYNENGSPTNDMTNILNKIYQNGKTIIYSNNDLTENCNSKISLDPETFHNMNDLLDSYLEYFDKCSYFIIEQQMNFGKFKTNHMALKLGHHCYSYFTFKYGRFKKYIEFPAYHKTQILGSVKKQVKSYKNGKKRWKTMDKPDRKKWSIQKSREILTEKNETSVWNDINKLKKKDDISDCITQLQSFIYLHFIDNKIF